MGVGGLDDDGTNYGIDDDQEVSALSGGGTVGTYCPPQSFCDPNGAYSYTPPFGGTSSSTAIVAGIAGLVRTFNPSLSASGTRQRLINTSSGNHDRIDAYRAVTNDMPLTVYISGPAVINSNGNYSWEAMPEDGNTSYSYVWEYKTNTNSSNWTQVGTSKTYSRYVTTSDQDFFLRVTVTSGQEQESATRLITVTSDDCPPDQICIE